VEGAARSRASADGPVANEQRESGTGFVFHEYTSRALLDALNRALTVFQDGKAWRAMQVAGMKVDHSWDRSAGEYVKIYERAAGGGGRGGRV
jgi:starch synthase